MVIAQFHSFCLLYVSRFAKALLKYCTITNYTVHAMAWPNKRKNMEQQC